MGLRSPYGNGASDLASPVPQVAPSAPVQGPRAPAMAQAPQAAPSAPPQAQPTADEQALLEKAGQLSPDEQALLAKAGNNGDDLITGNGDDALHSWMRDNFGAIRQNKGGEKEIRIGKDWKPLSDTAYSALSKIGSFAAQTTPIAASVAGTVATVPAAGPLAPEAGGTIGYAAGEKLVQLAKHILGTKDAGDRDGMLNTIADLGVGAISSTAGMGPARFLEQMEAQYGGKLAMAQGAQAASQEATGAAGTAGVELMAHQTAPGTVPGQEQLAVAQKVGSGGFGAAPQAELMAKQAQQDAQVSQAWGEIKDSFAPKVRSVVENGVSSDEAFKPHEALNDLLDSKRQKIGEYKKQVFNQIGDKRVDASSLVSDFKATLGDLVDQKGNINRKIVNLDTESGRQLVKNWLVLKNAISRDAGAFSESGAQGSVDQLNKTFSGRTGGLDTFTPTGQAGSVGPVSSGDIAMSKSPAGTPLEEHYMPPNSSGSSESGIPIRKLDQLVDSLQDYWKDSVNHGDANAKKFGFLARRANELYYKSLDDVVSEQRMAPDFYGNTGLEQSVDMLKRHNAQYSKMVDNYTTLTDGLSSNPHVAVRQLLDSKSPDEAKMLFHALPQAQGDMLRRGFMDAIEERAGTEGPNRLFKASAVKRELSKYTPDALDTIFAGKTDQINAILDTASNLEKTRIDPNVGPPKAMADGIAKKLASLPYTWVDKGISFFRGNQPLYKYLSSPDFSDQVARYSKLASRGSTASKVAPYVKAGVMGGIEYGAQKVRGE